MALSAQVQEELGVESYCPVHRRWRKLPKHMARKQGCSRELVESALITGYLLVALERTEEAAEVRALDDVYGFIMNDQGICFARDADIELLRFVEASKIHDDRTKPLVAKREALQGGLSSLLSRLGADSPGEVAGQPVVLSFGPLQGFKGTIKSLSADGSELSLLVNGLDVKADARHVELA